VFIWREREKKGGNLKGIVGPIRNLVRCAERELSDGVCSIEGTNTPPHKGSYRNLDQ
jgi:hypothetical protein